MISIENNILLAKNSIFESVNRTIFTVAGATMGLLASTQTSLYNDENIKNIVRITAMTLLLLIIIYGYYNIEDYKHFLDNYKTKDNNGAISIYTDINMNILYVFLILLFVVFICNIVVMM